MCVLATFGFLELASFGGQLTMLTITGSHFNRIHSQYCKKIGMTYEEIWGKNLFNQNIMPRIFEIIALQHKFRFKKPLKFKIVCFKMINMAIVGISTIKNPYFLPISGQNQVIVSKNYPQFWVSQNSG